MLPVAIDVISDDDCLTVRLADGGELRFSSFECFPKLQAATSEEVETNRIAVKVDIDYL